ncbi:Maf family protein [soil metagenome]
MLVLRTPLILASASPRRRRLLIQLGLEHEVCVPLVDETLPDNQALGPAVEAVAQRKAESISRGTDIGNALILAADTLVIVDGEALGKPADPVEAHSMLRRLSGRTHTVITAIALVHPASLRRASAHTETHVTFASLSDDEIDAYVATGSPLDKAGAYGIQDDHGALLIECIDGDYYNVVGLPLRLLYVTLKAHFPDFVEHTSTRVEAA